MSSSNACTGATSRRESRSHSPYAPCTLKELKNGREVPGQAKTDSQWTDATGQANTGPGREMVGERGFEFPRLLCHIPLTSRIPAPLAVWPPSADEHLVLSLRAGLPLS